MLTRMSERENRLIDFDEVGRWAKKERYFMDERQPKQTYRRSDQNERKELPRFVTVGSVDDGKSTPVAFFTIPKVSMTTSCKMRLEPPKRADCNRLCENYRWIAGRARTGHHH